MAGDTRAEEHDTVFPFRVRRDTTAQEPESGRMDVEKSWAFGCSGPQWGGGSQGLLLVASILYPACPVRGFSKREPGIPPYCPIALPRPGYLAPGTRYPVPNRRRGSDTEHRRPSRTRAHQVCILLLQNTRSTSTCQRCRSANCSNSRRTWYSRASRFWRRPASSTITKTRSKKVWRTGLNRAN